MVQSNLGFEIEAGNPLKVHMRIFTFLIFIIALSGCGTPSLLITPVSNTNKLQEITVQPGRGWFQPKVAIIEVEGMLANARTGGFLQPGENKLSLFTQQMNHAANDPAVKAVVLRVNSPGGTVTASDTMYQTVEEFRRRTGKIVVASFQDIAASGAYYVACGADRIVTHPTSVVGSIGVIFNTFDIEQTLGKIGVRTNAIKSGPMKDMGSPFHKLSPAEREIMQGMVDEYYARFVSVVVRHRSIKDPETLKIATDGRVFSGEQAVALGLADSTGLLNDAIEQARHLAGAERARVIMYKRPYGYMGSIYASQASPTPESNALHLTLPDADTFLPTGFYYLWQP